MKRKRSAIRFFTLTILAMSIATCSTKNYAPQLRELEQSQAKWESQHINHYRFLLKLPYYDNTAGRTPLTVEVKDGTVISVVDARGTTVLADNEADIAYDYSYLLTIPRLFSYARETYLQKPPDIGVTYHPVLGYPASIYVDPYTEPCCQDFVIEVHDFEPLP